eukprot:1159815-Pelagomonas_calceolata.AAC.17
MNCVRLKARSLFRNAEHARNAYIVQIRGTCTPFVARSIYSDIKVGRDLMLTGYFPSSGGLRALERALGTATSTAPTASTASGAPAAAAGHGVAGSCGSRKQVAPNISFASGTPAAAVIISLQINLFVAPPIGGESIDGVRQVGEHEKNEIEVAEFEYHGLCLQDVVQLPVHMTLAHHAPDVCHAHVPHDVCQTHDICTWLPPCTCAT